MIKKLILVNCMLVLTMFAVNASAAENADSKAIRELYKKYQVAFEKKDAKTILDMTTNDYFVKFPNGMKQSRKQAEEEIKKGFEVSDEMKVDASIIYVKVKGKTAVALVKQSASGMMKDTTNTSHKMVDISTEKDNWIKTKNGWRIKSTIIIKEKTTIDGKAIDPFAASPK